MLSGKQPECAHQREPGRTFAIQIWYCLRMANGSKVGLQAVGVGLWLCRVAAGAQAPLTGDRRLSKLEGD